MSWPGPNPLIDVAIGVSLGLVLTATYKLSEIDSRANRIRRWHASDKLVDFLIKQETARDAVYDMIHSENPEQYFESSYASKEEKELYAALKSLPKEELIAIAERLDKAME